MTDSVSVQSQKAIELNDVLQKLETVHGRIEGLQNIEKELKEKLSELHKQGIAPTKFQGLWYKFNLTPGRTTKTIDDIGKAEIEMIWAKAKQEGRVTEKTGNPYWTLTKIKTNV